MAMISGGDESARNAFRAYLRDDSSQLSIISTEEMSPGDVLEVRNLADAIERAEKAMRESSKPRGARDMFADLGAATDDASGPAVYARPTPTPPPPRPATLIFSPVLEPLSTPLPVVAAAPVLMVPNEEDAFTQPAGRMRHFADETLDGYRPDSTFQVRIGARRKSLTLVVGGILGVLAIALGAGVVMACMPAKAEMKPSVAVPAKTADPVEQKKSDVPTMNVNDLPSAR